MLSLLFFACSVMIACSKIGILILADAAYYEAWRYMPVLCCAMLLLCRKQLTAQLSNLRKRRAAE